ncbi:unnamed protein product [Bemisia tabaci]|uniref:Uncharacterized protein n=1 Tax=Bemisia tabaci TaxID=7038 RepID=A0A9P0API5_BEMTA|nr:unnamed protein product [Bemisia tabaci]
MCNVSLDTKDVQCNVSPETGVAQCNMACNKMCNVSVVTNVQCNVSPETGVAQCNMALETEDVECNVLLETEGAQCTMILETEDMQTDGAELFEGSRASLHRTLKKIGFEFNKLNNRIVLMEKPEIALKRCFYLRAIKKVDWNKLIFQDKT